MCIRTRRVQLCISDSLYKGTGKRIKRTLQDVIFLLYSCSYIKSEPKLLEVSNPSFSICSNELLPLKSVYDGVLLSISSLLQYRTTIRT